MMIYLHKIVIFYPYLYFIELLAFFKRVAFIKYCLMPFIAKPF